MEGEQEEDSRLTLLRVVVEVHAWEEEVVGEEGEGEGEGEKHLMWVAQVVKQKKLDS